VSPFIDVKSTDDDEDDDDDDDDNENSDMNAVIKLDWKTQTTIQEADDMETMIEKAARHVQQAKDMRNMLIGKAKVANDWNESIRVCPVITDERWDEAVDTIVGDYCQNLGLPQLGEHQPGETYYFSPLTVNCFGLANVGLDKAHLTAYIYHEGEGKKGGNNVASLIMKYLDNEGLILRRERPRKELNIVMDNCGGQNKNKFVIRLAPLLCELKYYQQVNIIFLVAGHTKNAADQLFNLLKMLYRKSQCFTLDQLQQVLDTNQYVECIKVGPNDFKNMGQFEDDLYSTNPLSGNTKKYQLFYAPMDNPGVLYAKESNEAVNVQEMNLKKGHDITREQILQDFDFQELPQLNNVEGIRQIKQVELFSKWRKHVPDEYKSLLYDNPGEDIIQSVKDNRKKKKQYQQDEQRNLEAAEAQGILAS
jgi:hypothetical protein